MRPGQGGADAGTRTPNLPFTGFTLCRSLGVRCVRPVLVGDFKG